MNENIDNNTSKIKASMIGTLPPIKGMSDYCIELVESLANYVNIDFISFKKLYPEFLYPGGTKDMDLNFKLNKKDNVKIRTFITYYNPFTWAWAGWSAKSNVLHIQWWTTFLAPMTFTHMLFAKLKRKKIILTVHNVVGHETNWIDKLISRIIFMFPDHFILHSDNSIREFQKYFKKPSNKVSRIPHGIYDLYRNEETTKEKSRERLNIALNLKNTNKEIKQDTPLILTFGNIREYKGVDILIEAFAKVKQQLPDALLVIAGKNWVSWEPNQKLIDKYNLKDSIITFLEYVPMSDVKHHFTAADVIALPYKHFDSQSGPGNISLAFHKPLIVSNQGGLPDLVKNKEFVIETNDVDALAEKLIKILKNQELQKQLSIDAEDLCEEFSWDSVAKKTAELYKQFIPNDLNNKEEQKQQIEQEKQENSD